MEAVIRRFAGLADVAGRREAARALAASAGVDAVIVFVRDAEMPDRLVPAPGFTQTLPGGASWRAFLGACRTPGVHRGEVAYPTADVLVPACACVGTEGTALLFLGGACTDATLAAGELTLPLLGAALRAEQRTTIALGQAAVARETARQATTVAHALDAARADLAHALAEAGRLNLELQQEQAVRERLLGIVGHDLRTPLTAITMAAQAALRRKALSADDAVAVTRIARGAERMARMIHDLLDFTQARLGGGLPVTRVAINLDALCREGIAEFELSHPYAALRYQNRGGGMAECDPVRWGEVVSNLVGNAIKYGAPGRPIDVALEEEGDDLVFTVHNDGAPIDPDVLPFIFDPLRRGRVDHAGTAGSLGLGLYIVYEILRAHGGTIAVRSTAAEGTTFTVRLPREARDAAPPGSPAA